MKYLCALKVLEIAYSDDVTIYTIALSDFEPILPVGILRGNRKSVSSHFLRPWSLVNLGKISCTYLSQ